MADRLRIWLHARVPPRWGRVLAYLVALVGAPFVVAALGVWVLWVPYFALFVGLLPYLVLAGPGFAVALIWLRPSFVNFALVGLALNTLLPLAIPLMRNWMEIPHDWDVTRMVWSYGAVFSALWGGCFALLYRGLRWLLVAD